MGNYWKYHKYNPDSNRYARQHIIQGFISDARMGYQGAVTIEVISEPDGDMLCDLLNAKDQRITTLEAENARLHAAVDSAIRKLYAVVSRTEWVNAGYDPQEYDDMVKAFDDAPGA